MDQLLRHLNYNKKEKFQRNKYWKRIEKDSGHHWWANPHRGANSERTRAYKRVDTKKTGDKQGRDRVSVYLGIRTVNPAFYSPGIEVYSVLSGTPKCSARSLVHACWVMYNCRMPERLHILVASFLFHSIFFFYLFSFFILFSSLFFFSTFSLAAIAPLSRARRNDRPDMVGQRGMSTSTLLDRHGNSWMCLSFWFFRAS